MWKAVLSGTLLGIGTLGMANPNARTYHSRTTLRSSDDFTPVQNEQVQGVRNARGYCQFTLHLTKDDPAPGGMATLADSANCIFDVTYGVYSRTPLDDSSRATQRTPASSAGTIYVSNRYQHR